MMKCKPSDSDALPKPTKKRKLDEESHCITLE
ncbi:unnamed protein product [Strongylus vulgaris]|uniref:Uncharacterized protein n=1 Tax=Strongylus vulgaris TaxID=40348 RepID=A0A3P7JSG6_STRVU|nr:unnamed protein product [Strongylus vulgaris]